MTGVQTCALPISIREDLDVDRIELVEMDNNINDDAFAEAAVDKLLELMEQKK